MAHQRQTHGLVIGGANRRAEADKLAKGVALLVRPARCTPPRGRATARAAAPKPAAWGRHSPAAQPGGSASAGQPPGPRPAAHRRPDAREGLMMPLWCHRQRAPALEGSRRPHAGEHAGPAARPPHLDQRLRLLEPAGRPPSLPAPPRTRTHTRTGSACPLGPVCSSSISLTLSPTL
jgi:hypothetical protein